MDATFPTRVRIATRASNLALWQSEHVASLLRSAAPGIEVELVQVTTTGDTDRTQPLSQMGGVGVFTREVQRAVLDGRADIAVHSLKDLPTDAVPGLRLAGIPQREQRFDALILPAGSSIAGLAALPCRARIGTGSLRRQAQLRYQRTDLQLENIRGNVETRIRKLDDGEFDAIVLAQAGLHRLGFANRISLVLRPPEMLPAVGQAAIGIECRADDTPLIELLGRISDPVARAEVTLERACLSALRAGCHAPVGVWARVEEDQLVADGVVLSPDGKQRVVASVAGTLDAAAALGRHLADELSAHGGATLINAGQAPG
ncbi:MAG: hydroxymethylbilane synthase [Planctomycetaceae bacterium]|nr:hydroxymethylbilane synthase [Planctomycetaceae bacterium]